MKVKEVLEALKHIVGVERCIKSRQMGRLWKCMKKNKQYIILLYRHEIVWPIQFEEL